MKHCSTFLFLPVLLAAQDRPIVIRAGTILDGRGRVLHDTSIVVQGSKIQEVKSSASPVTYDLHNLTILPGLIDTHVHITWHFGPDGRYMPRDASAAQAMGYAMENAYVTLMAGFTTGRVHDDSERG
ncbi:Amidohydrolase (fragment) [Burkholderiales bacterium]